MQLSKLSIYTQKEIVTALIFDGLSYPEIEEKFKVSASDIAEIIDQTAVQPYNNLYPKEHGNQDLEHKKTIFGWVKGGLGISLICFVAVVLIQSLLGGFEGQIVTDSLAYITQPLAKIVNLGIAVSFLVTALYLFFPILATFINEKVNTVSLKSVFMEAKPESKLNFLGVIVLALCLLVGLVFSAKGQTNLRECVVNTAYKEVGVLEKGGNNRGKRIDEYRSVSLNKTVTGYADAWCGYFVSFVYKTCCVPHTVRFSPRARDWFQDTKKIVWRRNFQYGVVKPKPQKGDLIGYMFKAGTIGHIEILYEWHEDYFLSIGGNTSNKSTVYRDADKNDGVRLKKRDIATAYIIANHID